MRPVLPLALIPVSRDWAGIVGVVWALFAFVIVVTLLMKTGTFIERSSMGIALGFVSMPIFWLGLGMLFLFSTRSASSRSCRATPTSA